LVPSTLEVRNVMRFRVEFHGGFRDGDVIVDSPGYVVLTENGRVGAKFREVPDWRDEEVRLFGGDEAVEVVRVMLPILLKEPGCQLHQIAWRVGWEKLLDAMRKRRQVSEQEVLKLAEHVQQMATCHLYEVTLREETPDQTAVHVSFVGEERPQLPMDVP
jgi:hypothetical protein